MKTGVYNDIFWSEIGSGFGEPGGTPSSRIPRSTHPGAWNRLDLSYAVLLYLQMRSGAVTICMKNPVIPGRSQMERFIPVEKN